MFPEGGRLPDSFSEVCLPGFGRFAQNNPVAARLLLDESVTCGFQTDLSLDGFSKLDEQQRQKAFEVEVQAAARRVPLTQPHPEDSRYLISQRREETPDSVP